MEIENFAKNKDYFYFLLLIYEKYLVQICQAYSIPYVVIDAKKASTKKLKKLQKFLLNVKLIINFCWKVIYVIN